MYPYIEDTKPVRPRLRIKNRIRFIVFLLLILCTFLTFFIPKRGVGQVNYKPFKVACGDTYWGIAKQLQEQGYRPRADIRMIVHELISKSGIKPHELKEGDTIYIPVMEGLE